MAVLVEQVHPASELPTAEPVVLAELERPVDLGHFPRRLVDERSDDAGATWKNVLTADQHVYDVTIDPSDRTYGTLWGRDPRASNYGAVGFARNCTPEAWLSTWSGLSSNAALAKTVPSIAQPVLFVEYTGDVSTFPSVARSLFAAIGTSQKTHLRVRGDHHGRALAKGEELGRNIVGAKVRDWLREQFA